MDTEDYKVQTKKIGFPAVLFDSAQVGRCRRPRLYWVRGVRFVKGVDLRERSNVAPRGHGYHLTEIYLDTERPPLEWFLQPGAKKGEEEDDLFPTFTRPICRQKPPDDPAGLNDCATQASP